MSNRIPRSHQVTIYRASLTVAAGGQRKESWSAVGSAVECNIQPKTGSLRQMASGREAASVHAGFFPSVTDVRKGDELVVTKGDYLSTQLRVDFAGHHGSRWDIECDLSESTTKLS